MFRSVLNEDTPIQISGNGIIRKNGQTSLKIQVEIGPAGGQVGGVGAGQFPVTEGRPPRIGAGRLGRRPGAGGRGPGKRPGAGAGVPGGPGAGTEVPGAEEEGPGAGMEGPGEEGPGAGIGGPETGGESITRSSMFFLIHLPTNSCSCVHHRIMIQAENLGSTREVAQSAVQSDSKWLSTFHTLH